MIDSGAKNKELRDLGSLPPQPGDVIADKYRVENLVGSGGMGVVVAARHLQLGQRVAIKLLRLNTLEPDRQVEACARFLREGQAAAGLSSDHVVRIHDVGTLDTGEPFMVMELLRGEDLAQLIERQGPAPFAAAVDYILQACHAVGEAHTAGIVHRDLKPSNLFVSTRSDGRATVKVLDFGISKTKSRREDAFDGNLTDTRSVVGSPYYMSPEQVRDAKRVDERTDIWSLGIILYELLVGEPAFNGDTLPAICAAIAADPPRSLRASRPDVPEDLERVVMKCLAKNPDDRYRSVEELVRALAAFAPGSLLGEGAVYASARAVLSLSEPFSTKARNLDTVHLKTDQPAPPASVAGSLEAPGSEVAAGKPTKIEPLSPTADSGEHRRPEFAKSSTLVSSSSKAGPAESSPAVPGRPGHRLLLIAAIAAAVVFVSFGLWPRKAQTGSTLPAAMGLPQHPATGVATSPGVIKPPGVPAPEAASAGVAPSATPAPPSSAIPVPSIASAGASAVRPASPGARSRLPRKPSTPATATPAAPSDIRLER